MSLENEIKQSLKHCYFNNIERSFDELGMQTRLLSESTPPSIILTAPFPIQQHYTDICKQLKDKLPEKFKDYDVQCQQNILASPTQLTGQYLKGVKNVIAVASGKGGVGKSTIAVNLAVALAKSGARCGILDADIYGPSIPIMLGTAKHPESTETGYLPIEVYGIQAMSIGFLTQESGALIWRGPMLAKSLLQMMNLCLWDKLDYLIIHLPPGTGDIQLSLVQKIPLAGAVVVTTPQQIATADADKALQMFKKTGIRILGLIENMSQHVCSQCGHTDQIFGDSGGQILCDKHQISFLGKLPLQKEIQEDCDRGKPSAASQGLLAKTFGQIALEMTARLSCPL